MSNGKHSRAEEENGGRVATTPAKKARKVEVDGEVRKETVKEKATEAVTEAAEEAEEEVEADAEATGTTGTKLQYKQTAGLTALPESEIQAFMKKEQVAVTDPLAKKDAGVQGELRPILEFGQLPATKLTRQKPFAEYKKPTPIQSASWPFTLSGRDVVGIAETGSGKTMAFALPCVEAVLRAARPEAMEAKKLPNRSKLNNKWDGKGNVAQARAVVVSPTRELAMQTHAALAPLAARVGLTAVCLYGGASKDEQRVQLRQAGGVDVIVATPGRLKDFLADEAVSLAHVCFAVLDEADRMLDTGFEEDIRQILGQCPDRTQRQTLMFTATWPTSVRGLAQGFMVDPVKITTVEVMDQHAKERRVLAIIKQEQRGAARNDRILVFCLYKKEAVRVENFLQGQGVRVCSIHGDLRQEQRTRSLEAFKTGQTPVLVATDVAARGLDIPEVKLVINVTFPLTIEDYVHRIGRTGRAGKDGRAITFFTEHDKAHSGSLVNILRGANQEVPDDLLKFGTTVKKKAHGTYGAFFKDVDMSQKGTKITFD
ncbi:ATP-dependent RNA helicase dbp3 [Grosmannia clavigera kw1407]|uniref:RNA helicase n=1 Tax=Grosmannia clavigera (strain kw1407 / UAMH 11150) TaxID=655863 RepID=F0XHU0_GROCL|nr:ATP-dependent RNA helicase dbp3 [Grosmannia clavigera kw1407]EFX03318.1 ATP-dependent RNA helicase dbp3 [Grosmannia clavigera kw1407]